MGIFSRFRKKKEKSYAFEMEKTIAEAQEARRDKASGAPFADQREKLLPLEAVDVRDEKQRKDYLEVCCDLLIASDREIEKQRKEYQQINDCLADIHEIMELPEDIRGNIGLMATESNRLVNQRRQSQEMGKNRLPEQKYLRYSQYRDEMPKLLQKLEQEEQYFNEVRSDLQHLEGEKAVISFQRKSLTKQRANLKGLTYILAITLLVIFLILFAMKIVWKMDIILGYLMTIVVVAGAAAYTFLRLQRNNKERAVAGQQMNRVITLINKVKIKYVNAKNTIDYMYGKFGVNSSHELRFEWEQYQQMKRDQEAFSRYGKELADLEDDLAEMLKAYPIRKIDLWVRRTDILVDAGKMKQEKKLLEKQRKQVQESMEYNVDTRQEARERIEALVSKYPEYAAEVIALIEKVDNEAEKSG